MRTIPAVWIAKTADDEGIRCGAYHVEALKQGFDHDILTALFVTTEAGTGPQIDQIAAYSAPRAVTTAARYDNGVTINKVAFMCPTYRAASGGANEPQNWGCLR